MVNQITASSLFQALSDSTRIRMVRLLAIYNTKMCVCEFVDVLQVRQYNVSKHLKLLESIGLTHGEKDGKWTYFGLKDENADLSTAILNLIKVAPQSDEQNDIDDIRFKERVELRENGKCKVGILTKDLSE
jgi:ArsR family transcriptional regulator, arsenate/arsenite/antimonite-responsive transcriptional repressor